MNEETATFIPPRALVAGSRILAVAPSSPFDVDLFHRGVAFLRERYDVEVSDDIFSKRGFLAGDDSRRERELRAALERDDVDAVVPARGGYGLTRILSRFEPHTLRRAPLVIGFSDATALHVLARRARIRSIHGPMIASLGRSPDSTRREWIALAEGAVPQPLSELVRVASGRASGVLAGGNLTVLSALLPTPSWSSLAGSIVFLEDVGERPYRVDRMLTTMRDARAFDGVRGFVLGAFTDAPPGADGVTTDDVLGDRLGDLGVPVVRGVPSGHVEANTPIPLGARVSLDADARVLTFDEPATLRPRMDNATSHREP